MSALEDLGLTGPSLRSGVNAPPPASQAFVPGGASEVQRAASAKRPITLGKSLAKSYST